MKKTDQEAGSPAETTEKPPLVKMTSLQRNMTREMDGDWIDLPALPGAAVNVRSLNYPHYIAARDRLFRQINSKYGAKVDPQRNVDMQTGLGQLYAKYILRGWRGFDEEYSPELAAERLGDIEWAPLRDQVEWAAQQVASKNVEFVEDTAKN